MKHHNFYDCQPLRDYLHWASKWASCWLYTENLHPMLQLILFGVWLTYITSALERKLKSSPLLRSICKTFFQFLGIHAEATTLWRRSALLFDVYSLSLAVACFQSVSYTSPGAFLPWCFWCSSTPLKSRVNYFDWAIITMPSTKIDAYHIRHLYLVRWLVVS